MSDDLFQLTKKQPNQTESEQSQLSIEVARLMQDKASLVSTALANFSDWDADKDQSLSQEELNKVSQSPGISETERAAASILAQNYKSASSLSSATVQFDRKDVTNEGRKYIQRVFGGDNADGITKRDLEILALVEAPDGKDKISHALEQQERSEAAIEGASAGMGGVAAAVSLWHLLNPSTRILALVFMAASALAALKSGKEAVDLINSDDSGELAGQFEHKKESLDNWQTPAANTPRE